MIRKLLTYLNSKIVDKNRFVYQKKIIKILTLLVLG